MASLWIRFANLFIAALLAGTSFGIWMGFNPVHFSPSTYVEQQQNLVRSLNTLMVSLVVIATLLSVVSAVLQKKDRPVFIALLFAAACFAACIVISRFGNLPIQNEMLRWNVNSLPSDWTVLRDKWWSLHMVRTIAELLALALLIWASIRKSTAS